MSTQKNIPKDTKLGWKMYRWGKIRLLPSLSRAKEVREIFKAYEKGGGRS